MMVTADGTFQSVGGLDITDERLHHEIYLNDAKDCAKHPHIEEKGYVLYYTSQCPFNAKYVPILEQLSGIDEVSYRAMMGEYILYYRGRVFGGISEKETASAKAIIELREVSQ